MKTTSVLLASTIVVLAIASHGAEAAMINPSPLAPSPGTFATKFDPKCKRDHNKCYRFIPSLCGRLLKRGLGGNKESCSGRKALRCDIRLDRCQAKADKKK